MKRRIRYKPIPGHRGYRAGSDGTIWSCWALKGSGYAGKCKQVISATWKRLKGAARKEDARLRYTLRKTNGGYRRRYGSTFVLEAFAGPRPTGLQCCHKDGNCLNDAPHNLRWGTDVSNKKDMVRHGTIIRGAKVHTAKLVEADVKSIRLIGYPLKQHALAYGVSEALVSAILKRKIWKHVK